MKAKFFFFISFVFFPLFLVLIFDLFFGRYFFSSANVNETENMYTRHPIYHHTIKPNFNLKQSSGKKVYAICSNNLGFKSECNLKTNKNFDLAFIGDSVTEGFGQPYEETFVGIIKKESKLKVANFSASSYSPIIYFFKTRELLNDGVSFEHLVVFIDISDIQDEAEDYRDCVQYVCERILLGKSNFLIDLRTKLVKNFPLHYNLYKKAKNLFLKRPNRFYEKGTTYLDKNYNSSAWTYNQEVSGYGDVGVEGGIKTSLLYMEKLHKLLEEKEIKLSVAVYPWPGQLLHDQENSLQVKIWKKFCENKCSKFINYFPVFFEYLKHQNKNQVIEKFYTTNSIHFNEDGNKLIANFFIKNIL